MQSPSSKFDVEGFGLIQVIVAAAILAVVSVGFMQLMGTSSRSSRKIASAVGMEIARQSIAAYIDCESTFQAGASDAKCYDPVTVTALTCPLTSLASNFTGPSFRLARRTANGGTMWLTDPLAADGTTRFGDTVLKVGCSMTDQSLIVKIAPYEAGKSLDWANAKILFGSGPGLTPLCFGLPSRPRPDSPYYPWHNAACKWDVNNDRVITAFDAIPIVNMRLGAPGGPADVPLTALCQTTPPKYYDVNKNGMADTQDVNEINTKLTPTGVCP